MANGGLTENEMLEQIAYQITKNQISFDTKSEDEKKDLMPKIDLVAASQMGELKKSFNSVILSIHTEVTPEAKLLALQGITDKVMSQGISSVEMAFSSSEIINMVTAIAVIESARNREEDTREVAGQIAEGYVLGEMISNGDKDLLDNLPAADREAYIRGKEIAKEREDAANDLIDKANGEGATENTKKASVAMGYLVKYDTFIRGNIKFDELTESDQKEFAAMMRYLADEQPELMDKYLTGLGVELDELKKSKYEGVDFDFDYEKDGQGGDEEQKKQQKIDGTINATSSRIQGILNYPERYSKEVFEMELTEIIDFCKESPYGVDIIFKSFYNDTQLECDFGSKEYIELAKLGLEMARDSEKGTEFDGYLASYMKEAAIRLYEVGEKDLAEEIVVLLNEKEIEGFPKIDMKSIEEKSNEIAERRKRQVEVEQEEDISFDVIDDHRIEYDYEQDEEIIDNSEDKHELSDKAIYEDLQFGLAREGEREGIEHVQELVVNMLDSGYQKKELLTKAVIEYLESQKDSPEFMEKDVIDSRKELYSAIIVSGVGDRTLFERMGQIDPDTSKVVVNETIARLNDDPVFKGYANVVDSLQAMAGAPKKEKVLDAERSSIIENIADAVGINIFDEKKKTPQPQQEIEDDDWSR